MSELAPLKKTPPSQIGNSKTGALSKRPQKSKKEELPPGESEPPEVRDKRRQRLLKCLGDNIEHNYLFNAFVESLGVKERGTCKGRDAVLKLSWTPVNRLPEGAAYAILNKRPVEVNGRVLKVKTDNQKAELVPGFVKQLTLCLAQANDTGVLHRDISAGNVCVKNDKVYVIDWGCAKVIGWGTAEDAARDTDPTQLKHIEVAEQWGFNATTVGQVEVAKDPFTGTPLFMGIPMLSSSPIRGILDDMESVFYVVMDAVRSAH
ncbi:hypothetical protein BX661DRAFT_217936 [Kickxella alabastrina]|uniref:uncharacterized protein n=1 Tax=Kickxella alabastrina TaxID=61397 RepID=UPI00221ED5C3|nr:uncharacterized protein BX661DRAFT_217936 [Kickxella alabastrina]KAI7820712.1 hypothetical protein BX661DRAFT_217936 [Kickxella alabastrina]